MLMNLKRIRRYNLVFSSSSSLKSYSTTTLPVIPTPNPNPTEPLTKPHFKSLVLNQYSVGKFSNLTQKVICLPSVLLTASQNLANALYSHSPLLHSVSNCFSIEEFGREIREDSFDFESHCVKFEGNERGDSLVLPDLKLKVLIEAIRMVLEVVYDERFVTFSYGGRVGMGRHTAIRYLKNYVENPSWWFSVSFHYKSFSERNVDKLCLFIGEKIKDRVLIYMIKRLFECGVLRIDLGGCYLGRGFPQECGMCSILINIYFDRFDQEIQEMRLKMTQNNPKIDSDELISRSNVFYKPVKMYAVRHFDEILVITSGSKMLTVDLKNRVLDYLEGELVLKVDKVNTAIHSAVSEKISFLGMELQAVQPSVLRKPLSEKAVRARKKYLRQKEIKALELRNARERNRKKLGLKIFKHVFKKMKQSNAFKFEFQIENEVRDLFKACADEVVQEFLGSLEECSNWHCLLTSGDFLSLRHIRDQLPDYIVDAYDNFQEQVHKHLTLDKARRTLENEKRKAVEEEKNYVDRTVDDLTRLCMKVSAPIELVRKAVKMVGFTNHMGRPRPIDILFALEDTDIIKWYAGIGRRWLYFFCCCHNFKMVKIIVSYHLRFSCILTLAEKHGSTKKEAISHFGKDLKVFDLNGNEELHFPSERDVKMMGDRNPSDPKPVDGLLSLFLIRLASDEPPHFCSAHFCERTDTTIYRVRLLQDHLNLNPLDEEKWVSGMGVIHEYLHRKCLPLCSDHISDLYLGKITLQDIDYTSFIDVD